VLGVLRDLLERIMQSQKFEVKTLGEIERRKAREGKKKPRRFLFWV
jgi:hypothetical protein